MRDRRQQEFNELGDPYMAMPSDDPAQVLKLTGSPTIPVEGLYRSSCYICRDPEFAQMGLPLCYPCAECGGHVPADDEVCENGHIQEHP